MPTEEARIAAEERERQLRARLEKISVLKKVINREKALKVKEKEKKRLLLRLPISLWDEIAAWAEDDFRSINGQIEYLLTESVRERKKHQ